MGFIISLRKTPLVGKAHSAQALVLHQLAQDAGGAGFVGAMGVEFHGEVELERIRGQGLFDLRLTVEGLSAVARHVQGLGNELRRFAGALDGEQHFVKEVADGGVEILFVGLLFFSRSSRCGWPWGMRPSALCAA
jgi:hypothetical protein